MILDSRSYLLNFTHKARPEPSRNIGSRVGRSSFENSLQSESQQIHCAKCSSIKLRRSLKLQKFVGVD